MPLPDLWLPEPWVPKACVPKGWVRSLWVLLLGTSLERVNSASTAEANATNAATKKTSCIAPLKPAWIIGRI
jgi:hypothetical protein